MKNIFVLLCLLLPGITNAQSVFLGQLFRSAAWGQTTTSAVKSNPDKALLAAISDSMFQEGNPKYIWVDLLKDGYIPDADSPRYYLSIELEPQKENMESALTPGMQKQYVDKWNAFVKHIDQPHRDSSYVFDYDYGIMYSEVTNPLSRFRRNKKHDLFTLNLAATGHLRLYHELIKDRLTKTALPIDFNFSNRGFYVNGKAMNDKLREKYMQLFAEEFGVNFYSDGSSYSKRPIYGKLLLGDEIEELTAKINAIK